MNPILTLTVEGTKASSAGTVSVGEKVDISVTGLGSISIPFLDEAETKSSLRFRLVDEQGHDVARFPLESTDAWTVTSGTYSASSVNLNTTALRKAFEGVAYGDRLQFGIILDSAVDYAQYARGKTYVQQWSMSSIDDPKVLPDWREVLAKLESDLATVSSSKATAIESASAAVSAKNAASNYSSQAGASALTANAASQSASASSSNASTYADTASTKATEASTSASNAETYKNQAAASASAASASADSAASVLSASVKKSGDTMTGTLSVPAVTLNGSDLAGLISAAEASAESAAQAMVSEEAESRENADEVLSTTMAEEVQDRKDADLALAAGISTERARAEGAESTLTSSLAAEVSRAMGVEAQLASIASGHMKMSVVDTLPSTGVEKTIYLVPAASSKTGNVKDEYLWVNNAWEKIGSTAVDLSDYAKTEDLADVATSGSYEDLSDRPLDTPYFNEKSRSEGQSGGSQFLSVSFVINFANGLSEAKSAIPSGKEYKTLFNTVVGNLQLLSSCYIRRITGSYSYTSGNGEDIPESTVLNLGLYVDADGASVTSGGTTVKISSCTAGVSYYKSGDNEAQTVCSVLGEGIGYTSSGKAVGYYSVVGRNNTFTLTKISESATSTSQLTNDAGFVTADAIPVKDNIANSSSKIDAAGNVYEATSNPYAYYTANGVVYKFATPIDGGIYYTDGNLYYIKSSGIIGSRGTTLYTAQSGLDLMADGVVLQDFTYGGIEYKFTKKGPGVIPSTPTDRLARECVSATSATNIVSGSIVDITQASGDISVTFADAAGTALRYCELIVRGVTADGGVSISLPSGMDALYSEGCASKAGINHYIFAEYSRGHWLVSRVTRTATI